MAEKLITDETFIVFLNERMIGGEWILKINFNERMSTFDCK